MISLRRPLALLVPFLAAAALTRPAHAYVDLAPTIAKVIKDSRNIAVVELVSLDRPKRMLTVKELKVLKGDKGSTPLVHLVGEGETAVVPRAIVQWAEPGAQAVVFSTKTTAIVCVGSAWYQLKSTGKEWKLGADRPELALTYYGTVGRLSDGLEKMLAGGDAVLTMMPHAGDQGVSFDLALNRIAYPGLVKVERLRANLNMPGTVWSVSNSPTYKIGMGPVDVADLPLLVRQLDAPDAVARASAAADIRELTDIVGAGKTASVVPSLEKRLSDAVPRVRVLAAGALLRITHGHDAARKVLADALASEDATIRRDAADAAAITGKAGEPVVGALAKLLKDPDDATRFAALQALATLGPVAASARDAVVPLLDNADIKIDAADALGRMGPGARPVPAQMVKMLASDQSPMRLAALRGMCQIGGKEALPAAEYIAREIATANEIDAYNMVELLALLGPVASEPAARIRSIPMPNPILPAATNWAINGPSGFPWLDENGFGAGDLGNLVYSAYVAELGERLKPCALALAPRLIAGKAGDVPEWGYKILNAAPAESIATIAPHLSDKEKTMRERAATILGRMGPPAVGAREKLETAIAAASDEREKHLMEWALREITKD